MRRGEVVRPLFSLESVSFLIVDDSEEFRGTLKDTLRDADVRRVIEAPDGARALRVLDREPIDIVLLGWKLYPVDGLTFTRRVRDPGTSPNPHVRIIMISSKAGREDVLTAWRCGIDEFLVKPVSRQTVLERVRVVIERPRPIVAVKGYVGPDRRRTTVRYQGPDRRATAERRLSQDDVNRLMRGAG